MELATQFGVAEDPQQALYDLRKIKQKGDETIQVFAGRIRDIARDAFPGVDLADATVSRQLIDFFTDGLSDRTVARRVVRDGPQTLAAALTSAVNESTIQKKFRTKRLNEEPIEIGQVSKVPQSPPIAQPNQQSKTPKKR